MRLLNFAEQTGDGAFSLIWPSTKVNGRNTIDCTMHAASQISNVIHEISINVYNVHFHNDNHNHKCSMINFTTTFTFTFTFTKSNNTKSKSRQHSDFPGGHPPEYYPSLRLLNFAEQTGYGAFSLIWPSTSITR